MNDYTAIPKGYKRCAAGEDCLHPEGPVLPESSAFFHWLSKSRNKLHSRCKLCRSKYENDVKNGVVLRPRPLENGMKRCNCCENEKPATPEYFHRFKTGHLGLRATCKECIRIKHQKYDKAASARKWQQEHKEQYREYHRRYAKTHPPSKEKIRERNKKRWANHKDKERARKRLWRSENKEKARERVRRRRRIKKNALGSHTAEDVLNIYKVQKGQCYWCGIDVGDNYHVDHRIPLSRGGSDNPDNIVISCPNCNLSKGSKLPHEWCGQLF